MSYDDESYEDDFDDDDESEDSQRCPACGEYVTFSGGLTRKGVWWWVGWTLLAILAIYWLFGF